MADERRFKLHDVVPIVPILRRTMDSIEFAAWTRAGALVVTEREVLFEKRRVLLRSNLARVVVWPTTEHGCVVELIAKRRAVLYRFTRSTRFAVSTLGEARAMVRALGLV